MTTYYIDPANGNDANDGLGWGTAWKTLLNGATSARLPTTTGDEIRIAKSPDPVSIGNVTWTTASEFATFPTCSNVTVDNCETAWTAGLVTPTVTATYVRQGTNSLQMVMSATNGQVCYKATGLLDLSAHSRLTFWVNFSTASDYTAGCPIQIILNTQANGGGSGDTNIMNLPSLYYPANYWVPITIDYGTTFNSAILSVVIKTTSAVTKTMRIDNITAAKSASDASSLVLTDLVAKDNGNGEYFPIKSIVGTSVYLPPLSGASNAYATAGSPQNLYYDGLHGTQTITTLKRSAFNTVTPATTGAIVGQLTYTQSDLYPLTKNYVGGVNTATNIVDGETWFDGVTGYGTGIVSTTSEYANWQISNVGVIRYQLGMQLTEGMNVTTSGISIVNCTSNSLSYTANSGTPYGHKQGPTDTEFKWIHSGNVAVAMMTIAQPNPGAQQSYRAGMAPVLRVNNAYNTCATTNYTCTSNMNFVSTGSITCGFGSFIRLPSYGKVTVNNLYNIHLTTGSANATFIPSILGASCNAQEPSVYVTVTGEIKGNLYNTTAGLRLFAPTSAASNMVCSGANVVATGVASIDLITPDLTGYVGKITFKDLTTNRTLAQVEPANIYNSPGGGVCVIDNYNSDNTTHVYTLSGCTQQTGTSVWHSDTTHTYSGTNSWRREAPVTPSVIYSVNDQLPLGNIACKAGSLVTISVRCWRTTTTSDGYLEVWANHPAAPDQYTKTAGAAQTWELLTITFTPTQNIVVDVLASVTQTAYTTNANSYVYFDDLQVTQA